MSGDTTGREGDGDAWRDCVEAAHVVHVGKDGVRERATVSLVRELPFTVWLNGSEIITLLCAGVYLESLAVGFLRSEGLISDRAALEKVEIDEAAGVARIETREKTLVAEKLLGKRTITSGCGKGSTFHNSLDALQSRKISTPLAIPESFVRELMAELNERSELYRETHGVHNCALADLTGIVSFRNDIGRHNAVDMLIGEAFLESMPTGDKMLLTTGRITSEILIKAAKVGIPAIISRSSATSLALKLAAELNVTIIGRVRAGAMTIYGGAENVTRG